MVKGNLALFFKQRPKTETEIYEQPVKWCSVPLSDIAARGMRLEASVFDVGAKSARTIIENGRYPSTALAGKEGIASSYVCGRFKRIWVESSDLPIFQPSSITDIKPVPAACLSHNTHTNIEALRVHRGQVLMTCSGTIGNVSFVSKTLDNQIFSHDLLRINCKDSKDAGYVYAYLKSSVGNQILLTNAYGAVITHIEPEHLATVPIPNAPKTLRHRIHNLVEESYELRDVSNDLIDEAIALLVEELHFPDVRDFNVALYDRDACVDTFSVKLSDMAGRADASYHVPIVNAITEHMEKYAEEVTVVGDSKISKEVILPGRFKRVYVNESHGRVFLGGKQIHELNPSNKKYLSITHHGDRIAKQLELHQGMTLITCSGTIGKTALVGKHWENWTASQHIIRVVPASDEIAGYLYIFLSSDYGHRLITRYTYGSVVNEIDGNHVRSIPIPLLKNRSVQCRINALALEASQKRYEAYRLEQKALDIMNKEIIFTH